MPKARPLSKTEIINAMEKTRSVKAAARYLNCSYQHLKPWMKHYKDEETGLSLFELHKNQCGKGIPKFIKNSNFNKKEPAILDIVEGRIDSSHFSPEKIRYRMIEAGLIEECCHNCGFRERRITDYKMPLILHFKDGNTKHYGLNNVQLLCYNCYFLFYGSVFKEKDIQQLEGHGSITIKLEEEKMKLDEYQIQMLKQLGLHDDKDDDPYSFVSYK